MDIQELKSKLKGKTILEVDLYEDRGFICLDHVLFTDGSKLELWGNKYLLTSISKRKAAYINMCRRLKAMDNKEKIIMLDKILSELDVDNENLSTKIYRRERCKL